MKIKNLFFLILCTSTIHNATAIEICPSVEEIQKHEFHHWLPLYINNEELVSPKDLQLFQTNVTNFVVARWDKNYLENGHCYYEGNDPVLQKMIFAQDAWRPIKSEKWVWKKADKLAECYSSQVQDCGFMQ